MPVDAIAFAGLPPPVTAAAAATPATSTAGSAPAEGDFASVIAAAMGPPEGAAAPVTAVPDGTGGVDLAALLAAFVPLVAAEGTPAPETELPRLDRDAGAELAAEAAGAAMLAALFSPSQPLIASSPTLNVTSSVPRAEIVVPAGLAGAAPATALDATASTAPAAVLAPTVELTAVVLQAALPQGNAGIDVPLQIEPSTVAPVATPVAVPAAVVQAAAPQLVAQASVAVPAADRVDGNEAPAPAGGDADTLSVAPSDATELAPRLDAPEQTPLARDARDARDEPQPQSPSRIGAAPPQPAISAAPVNDRPAVVASLARVAVLPQTVEAPDGPRLAANLAETVERATLNGDHELRLALNPPDLGQLTVYVTEHASGAVSVAIHASSVAAHDLLQQHLSALRSGLEQRDLRVEQLRVEQQSAAAGLGWQGSGQRQARGDEGESGQPEWSPLASMQRVESVGGVRPTVQSEHDGRVDVLA